MKYIKRFENIQDDIEIGDYVLCEEDIDNGFKEDILMINFSSTHIGKYAGRLVDKDGVDENLHIVEYENIPDDLKDYFTYCHRQMYRNEIKYWSKNSKDLEPLISANKYNL